MSDKLEGMPSSEVLVDPVTGKITQEWRDFFEELVFGSSARSVGTLLSGVTAAQAGVNAIKAGEVTLDDVILSTRGSLLSDQESQDSSVIAAAANALTVSVTPATLTATGTGSTSTANATVSVSGGTTPYAITYNSTAGFTATGVTSLASDGNFTVYWTGTPPTADLIRGVQNVHIEDSAGTPLEADVYVTVTIRDTNFGL